MAFDPLSIGLQGLGSLLQYGSSNAADEDIARNFAMEEAKRRAIENQGRKAFDVALAGIDPRVMAALSAKRSMATAGAAIPGARSAYGPAGGSDKSPAAVGRSVDRGVRGADLSAARNAELIASLSRGTDFFNDASERGNAASEKVATGQDFIRGNQSVLGMQNDAANAGRKNLMADLLMGSGQIIGGLNMFGSGAPPVTSHSAGGNIAGAGALAALGR